MLITSCTLLSPVHLFKNKIIRFNQLKRILINNIINNLCCTIYFQLGSLFLNSLMLLVMNLSVMFTSTFYHPHFTYTEHTKLSPQ